MPSEEATRSSIDKLILSVTIAIYARSERSRGYIPKANSSCAQSYRERYIFYIVDNREGKKVFPPFFALFCTYIPDVSNFLPFSLFFFVIFIPLFDYRTGKKKRCNAITRAS